MTTATTAAATVERGVDPAGAAPAPDPQARALEALFEDVHRTRMHDLPFLNAALRVEALGFRDWQAARIGALVTPWSVMIVALPAPDAGAAAPAAPAESAAESATSPARLAPVAVTNAGPQRVERLATGRSQVWTFPSGEYEFYGHEADALGHYQQCSLFSPALEFATHEDARAAALAALDALFASPEPPRPPEPRKYSRRGFLLGA